MTDERSCRRCGCTDARACVGGCSWVEIDLCSACAEADQLTVDDVLALDDDRSRGVA